jgi:hypothetical protein
VNWIQGVKHALTNTTIFRNLWEWDQLRNKLPGRCQTCDIVISTIEYQYKSILFFCAPSKCLCNKPYVMGPKMHDVCEVCDALFRSLYVNYNLKNRNYFKELDAKDGIL